MHVPSTTTAAAAAPLHSPRTHLPPLLPASSPRGEIPAPLPIPMLTDLRELLMGARVPSAVPPIDARASSAAPCLCALPASSSRPLKDLLTLCLCSAVPGGCAEAIMRPVKHNRGRGCGLEAPDLASAPQKRVETMSYVQVLLMKRDVFEHIIDRKCCWEGVTITPLGSSSVSDTSEHSVCVLHVVHYADNHLKNAIRCFQ